MIFPLELLEQTWTPENLSVETLGRQEKKREIRCSGRADVFISDRLSELPNSGLQLLGRLCDCFAVP